jgi:hypothetical protein
VAAAPPAIHAAAVLLAVAGCADLRDRPLLFGLTDGGGTGGAAGVRGTAGSGGAVTDGAGGTPGRPLDARPPADAGRRDAAAPTSPAIDFAPYLGTWRYLEGTIIVTCPGAAPVQDTLVDATFQLQRGTDAPLQYATPSCTWRLDTSGNLGLFRPGDSCATVDASGTMFSFTVVSGRFAPTPQNAAITIDLKVTSSELADTCDAQIAGTAVKILGALTY